MIEDGGKEEKGGIEVALTESGEKNERRTVFSNTFLSDRKLRRSCFILWE